MILLFILVQSILGFNNYFRSGKFYIMTADSKVNIYNDMVTHVVSKKLNITHREFVESEGKVVLNWLNENSIAFDKVKLKSLYSENGNNFNAPKWLDYRDTISEADKIRFDNFFRQRTLDFILEYPSEFKLAILLLTVDSACRYNSVAVAPMFSKSAIVLFATYVMHEFFKQTEPQSCCL